MCDCDGRARGRATVALRLLLVLGVTDELLQRCLDTYRALGVWTVEGGTLHFLHQ